MWLRRFPISESKTVIRGMFNTWYCGLLFSRFFSVVLALELNGLMVYAFLYLFLFLKILARFQTIQILKFSQILFNWCGQVIIRGFLFRSFTCGCFQTCNYTGLSVGKILAPGGVVRTINITINRFSFVIINKQKICVGNFDLLVWFVQSLFPLFLE